MPVFSRMLLDCIREKILLWKQIGIFSKITEKQTRHEDIKVVHLLLILYVVMTTYLVKYLRHKFGRLHIRLSFLQVANLLYAGKRIEKVKILPHQRDFILVNVLLLWVIGNNDLAIAYYIKTW
ncbi:unknown [Prevotella sp. CAG:924]|nr:unknown [Prevotella sp. CAG:924]